MTKRKGPRKESGGEFPFSDRFKKKGRVSIPPSIKRKNRKKGKRGLICTPFQGKK